jgi:hypothetical protein
MAIDVTCACGKVLQLSGHAAAAVGQCPACGRLLQMPSSAGEASQAVTADPGPLTLPALRVDTAVAEGSPSSVWPPSVSPTAFDDWGEIARPSYKLWSPSAIGLVAFLAGPIGPLLMMAINYARLGQRPAAWLTVASCLLMPAALIAVGLALPDNSPGMVLALPVFIIIYMAARTLQGGLYEAHVRAGGATASGWSAAGLGALGILLFLGVALGASVAYDLVEVNRFGTRIDFGGGQEIYHTRGATEADARALAEALRQAGFFDGRNPAAVQVAREGDHMIVAFIVQPWVLQDMHVQKEFRAIGDRASAQAFAGRRVEVWLCDELFNPKKKLP